MKRNKFLNLILAAGITLTAVPQNITAIHADDSIEAVYRLYNSLTGEHFFTADEGEKQRLINAGWTDEGIGFYAHSEDGDPVYRLYNTNGGEHHYTMDSAEREKLIAAGWIDEGIAFYSDEDEEIEVYRAYNPNAASNNHSYTVSDAEQSSLLTAGWTDEGIAWYACSRPFTSADAETNRSTIYTLLTDTYHLNKAAACGILANMAVESFYNPKAYNPEGYCGLCQWDETYRWQALVSWCRNIGLNRYSLEGQTDFMMHELEERGQLETLESVSDDEDGARESAAYFCDAYEVREARYGVEDLAAELYFLFA